ncbi:MAG: choice-of-anchor J domain-containing protein [Planctomycetes bacterium]|nr:choice-of-anchor J domain-containing protein [Planctomycetota bacterium]
MSRNLCFLALFLMVASGPALGQAPCGPDYFAESFDAVADDAALDAAGWQRVEANGATETATWTTTNPGLRRNPPTANGSPSTGKFVISDSDAAGGANNIEGSGMSHDLITPAFSTAGGTSVWVHASCNAQLNNGDDAVFDVDVSTDDGASWTNVFRRVSPGTGRTFPPLPDTTNADGFFGRLSIDISAPAADKASVRIRFRHFEPTDDWWVALDDIRVTCEAPPAGGSDTLLATQDFAGGLGAMTAVSLAGNSGTETWHTTDKGNRYVAGAVSGRGVNRINQPNPNKEFAILDSDANPDPAEDEYLRTPVVDCSGHTKVYLHWKSETVLHADATQEVLASVDGGATFPIRVFRYNEDDGTANALFDGGEEPFYAARVLEVPDAACQAQVVFAFHYKSSGDKWWWAVDDIKVTGSPGICDPRACELRGFSVSYDPAANKATGTWNTLPGDAGFRVLEGARVVADNLPASVTSFVDSSPPKGGAGVKYTLECLVSEVTPGGRGGWTNIPFTYCYDANAGEVAYVASFNTIGCLDGQWRRGPDSDQWDGSGSTPGAGGPGGVEIDTLAGQGEGGGDASVLSLEDTGDPRSFVPPFPDPSNRKLFLCRDTTSELDLKAGVTLVARWRLNPAPKSAEFANNGGTLPVPNGTALHNPNKGQIGFVQRQAGTGAVTASLSFAINDAGMLEFGTENACTAAPAQCFDVDENGWVTVWLAAIEDAGGVKTKIYLNGSFTPVLDQKLTGIQAGADGLVLPEAGNAPSKSYINIGMGSTGGNGALQVDYLCATTGFHEPLDLVVERQCVSQEVQTHLCPAALTCRADQAAKKVELQWTPGANLDSVGYEVRRNGVVIATPALTAAGYTDSPPLSPGDWSVNEYELAVIGGDPALCPVLGSRAIVSSGNVCFADDFDAYTDDVAFEVNGGWFRVDEVPDPAGRPGEDATWTVQNPGERANPPTFDGRASAGRFAISDSDAAGGDNGAPGSGNSNDLWSPSFSTTGKTVVWLHMDVSAQMNNNGVVVFDVDVSTDGGASWDNVYRTVAPSRTQAPPLVATDNADGFFGRLDVDLSAAANSPAVQFRLRSFEPSDDWWVAVDNVVVDDVPPLAGGSVTLFEEDFSGGLGNMAAVSLAGNSGNETWTTTEKCSPIRSVVAGPGTFPVRDGRGIHRLSPAFALMESECDPDPVEDELLVTQPIDCSDVSAVFLHWRSEIVVQDGAASEVLLSLDGGDTFLPEPIFNYKGGGLYDSGEDPFYAERVFSVSEAAGQPNVAFAFHYKSGGNQRYWAVDDVKVTGVSRCRSPFMAGISGADAATAGDTVRLTSSTDATGPATYKWSIASGDGSIAGSDSGDAADVTAAAEGSVTVRVTVTDDCGAKATADHAIAFAAPGGKQVPMDTNQDGKQDLSDAIALLGHLFLGTVQVLPCGSTAAAVGPGDLGLLDCNGDGKIDLSDAVCLLSFRFLGGPAPKTCIDPDCAECILIRDCPNVCP